MWRGIQNVVNIKNPSPNSTIGCILVQIRIMTLYLQHNTTYGWICPLLSGARENMSGRKNICLYSATRTKQPQDSTTGCASFFGCVWMMLIKPWKSRLDSSIGCILFKIRIMVLCSQHNTTYGWISLLFSGVYRKNVRGTKKLSAFYHPHKIAPRFDHWLYFGFWARLGDIGKDPENQD